MPSTVLLAALCSSFPAWAGAPDPDARADVPTAADLRAEVERISADIGSPVLVAAAGPDAERRAIEASKKARDGAMRIVRIGYLGDADVEVRRALTEAGLPCGLRLAYEAGKWTASRHGACTPEAVAEAAKAAEAARAAALAAMSAPASPVVVTGAGSGSASSGSGSASSGTGAPGGSSGTVTIPAATGTPPGPVTLPASPSTAPAAATATAPATTPAADAGTDETGAEDAAPPAPPAPTVAPPDPSVLESTLKLAALQRTRETNDGGTTWVIRDGTGHRLDALDFARRTGDLATERRIGHEEKTAKALSLGLSIGGGALTVSGLVVLVGRGANEPQRLDYTPDPRDYETNAEYRDALDAAETDFASDHRGWVVHKDDSAWVAGFLAATGILSMSAAPFATRGALERQHTPALWWDSAHADTLIATYNASLRNRLGLAPEKVAAPAPAPDIDPTLPENREPAKRTDPGASGTSTAPAGSAAPPSDEDPESDPLTPSSSPAPKLEVTPVLAPGWAGLTGRF
jgi:hypothetical protein